MTCRGAAVIQASEEVKGMSTTQAAGCICLQILYRNNVFVCVCDEETEWVVILLNTWSQQ